MAPQTETDPVVVLINEWITHDTILNQLSDAEFDTEPEHPSFVRCCEIERLVAGMTPTTTAGRIAKAGLMVVRQAADELV
jgi:hypothetical protein